MPGNPVPPSLLDDARTLPGALALLAERFPEHEALVFVDREWRERRLAFRALWDQARRVQAGLIACGLPPGRVVLLALPTSPELAATYFGVMLAGGIPALVSTPFHRFADPHVYAAHLGAILAVANAAAIYCTTEVAEFCRIHGALLPLRAPAVITPDRLPSGGTAGAFRAPEPESIAMIQYSSGSTGAPKGILLSHRAILNNVRSTRDGLGLSAADVHVNWAPHYHDMGMMDAFLLPFFGGARAVLMSTADFVRDPVLWLRGIQRYRATVSWAANFAYALCAKRLTGRDVEGLELSRWRVAMNASEPVLPESIEAFSERFAPYGYRPEAMTAAWGAAETTCIGTAHPVGEPPRIDAIDRTALATENVARPGGSSVLRLASVGKCLPGYEVEVRDERGRALPDRVVGTLWLRTDAMSSGYQGNPELTAEVFVDGWFNTGDRGYLADGHVFFVSREKDLIVIAGEKYAPHDVEQAATCVPGIREGCAVAFGVLNPQRGTEDVAVVAETKETDPEALAALREAIQTSVMRAVGLGVRHVLLVGPGGIAKTTSGKLARGATRRRYEERLST
jgi:fatty-acyl-CoA synthase